MRLVLATNNKGKLRELQALLMPLQIDVLPKSQFTDDEVAETGSTFMENALIKARHAARVSGLPAIADDSGIEVDALNGAPGIYSARYAGEHASDVDILHKLLEAMRFVSEHLRKALCRCMCTFHSVCTNVPIAISIRTRRRAIFLNKPISKHYCRILRWICKADPICQ